MSLLSRLRMALLISLSAILLVWTVGCGNGSTAADEANESETNTNTQAGELTDLDRDFHQAILDQDEETALRLLEEGASPHTPTDQGLTPLHLAARSGLLEVVIQLVLAGVELDPVVSLGMTPLQWAIRAESVEVTQFLIESGADINHVADNRMTALDLARFAEHEELIALLEEHNAVSGLN